MSLLPRELNELHREGRPLTTRQRQILQLYGQGFTRREIARKLVVSEETVKSHAANARATLKARTIAHAVALGIVFDLI